MRGKACRIVSASSVAPISTLEPIRSPAVPPSSRPPGPAQQTDQGTERTAGDRALVRRLCCLFWEVPTPVEVPLDDGAGPQFHLAGVGEAAERLQQVTAVLHALHRDENDVFHGSSLRTEDYCPETNRARWEVV